MKNPLIITIGREYGSGGRQIGRMVAEQLGISFYDKEIIALAAEKSGLCHEFIEDNEQRARGGLLSGLAIPSTFTGGHFTAQYMPLSESIFIAQSQVIRDIAEKESAVIVGRCADYVLTGREDTINVFIHAPVEARVRRIMELHAMDEAAAMKAIATSDKERGNHYFRYTDHKWGKAQNYDVCINSSLMGIKRSAQMLVEMARIAQVG